MMDATKLRALILNLALKAAELPPLVKNAKLQRAAVVMGDLAKALKEAAEDDSLWGEDSGG
jgi:hypothetical protein